MVEHMTACEKQYCDQTYSGPKVSILYDWDDVRRSNTKEGHEAQDCGGDSYQAHPIQWTVYLWFRSCGQMSTDPVVDLFSRL